MALRDLLTGDFGRFLWHNITLFLLNVTIVVWLSFFITWAVRFSFLPDEIILHKPLHFTFATCADSLHGLCSFPAANITTYNGAGTPFLVKGIPYRITIYLTVPESPSNRNMGMFLMRTTFTTTHGRVLDVVERSVLLSYRSNLFRWLRSIVFFPLLLFQWSQEAQVIPVEVRADFYENPYEPALYLHSEMQTARIQLQAAHVTFVAELGGLRHFLYYWPVTSTCVVFAVVLAVLGAMSSIAWLTRFSTYLAKRWRQQQVEAAANRAATHIAPAGAGIAIGEPPLEGEVSKTAALKERYLQRVRSLCEDVDEPAKNAFGDRLDGLRRRT